jgi:hypothetical protein
MKTYIVFSKIFLEKCEKLSPGVEYTFFLLFPNSFLPNKRVFYEMNPLRLLRESLVPTLLSLHWGASGYNDFSVLIPPPASPPLDKVSIYTDSFSRDGQYIRRLLSEVISNGCNHLGYKAKSVSSTKPLQYLLFI